MESHATTKLVITGYDRAILTSDEPHVTVRIGESAYKCNATAHVYFEDSGRPSDAPNPSYVACGYYNVDCIPQGSQKDIWKPTSDTAEQFTMLGVRGTQSERKRLRKVAEIMREAPAKD